ncbi:MAG: hypothetical protein ACTSWP_04980 [Candidatus Freyarchaeota archaeon]
MKEECPICNTRKHVSTSNFCENHQLAYENIKKHYKDWKAALDVTWDEYLRKILENANTGEWAKEVAKYLIENQHKDLHDEREE